MHLTSLADCRSNQPGGNRFRIFGVYAVGQAMECGSTKQVTQAGMGRAVGAQLLRITPPGYGETNFACRGVLPLEPRGFQRFC